MLGNFYHQETEAASHMLPIVRKHRIMTTNAQLTVQPTAYAVREPPPWTSTAYICEVSHLN